MVENDDTEGERLTIDELARRTGTTTRTLRLYQTKGLLPPPQIVGRVGYYSGRHRNRLVMIDRLQRRGFSLAGIAELFRIWQEGKTLDELLGIEAVLAAPWSEENAQFFTRGELEQRYPGLTSDPVVVQRAFALKLVVPEGDGYLVQSPQLLDFGRELVTLGVPVASALNELELLQNDARHIAKRFTHMFRKHVLPNVVTGTPTDWLPRLAEQATRLRPAVRGLVLNAFARAMDEEVAGYRQEAARVQLEAELESEEALESSETDPSATDNTSVETG